MRVAEYTSGDRSSVPLDLGAYGTERVEVSAEHHWATVGFGSFVFKSRNVSSSASPSWLLVRQFDSIGSTDPRERLRNRVRSYTSAPQPSGSTPNPDALENALCFIGLIPATARLPSVALADDGEINFYWRKDGLFIDVGFVGDGKMHYYVCVDAEGVDVDASVDFNGSSLPHDVVAAMPRLAEQRE